MFGYLPPRNPIVECEYSMECMTYEPAADVRCNTGPCVELWYRQYDTGIGIVVVLCLMICPHSTLCRDFRSSKNLRSL